jgi:uncharacterized membrane protein
MEIIFKICLALHIVAGTLSLLTGSINIIARKGGKQHRLLGKIFLISMLVVAGSAFILSIIHPNYFLFIVGVFTLYMVGSGTRYLRFKNLNHMPKIGPIDWLLTYFMVVFGVLFILFGIYHLVHKNTFGLVFIAFGGIGLSMVKADFNNFRGKAKEANTWLLVHIQRIIGAYIATVTAFLVVNNTILPSVVAWLLPSVILTPLIFKWIKKYKVNRIANP